MLNRLIKIVIVLIGIVIVFLTNTMFGGFILLLLLFIFISPIAYLLSGNIWLSLGISAFLTIPLAWVICSIFSLSKTTRIIGHLIFFIVLGIFCFTSYLYYDRGYVFTETDLGVGLAILFCVALFKVIIQCIKWEVK